MATMNLDRSLEQLMSVSKLRLASTTLSANTPGGIVRLLLSIVNDTMKDYYTTLSLEHAKAIFSTAAGSNLDEFGVLMDCTRISNESDDNYRYRISKQTSTLASANKIAVKLAVLSKDGVIDCKLRSLTHGTGSGSVYVITQDPYPAQSFIDDIQSTVDEIIAFGNRVLVMTPKAVLVEMGVKLLFDKKVSSTDQLFMVSLAKQAVRSYIANLLPESLLSFRELEQEIGSVGVGVIGIEFYKFIVSGKPALLVNQELKWNERFVEANKTDAIMVT